MAPGFGRAALRTQSKIHHVRHCRLSCPVPRRAEAQFWLGGVVERRGWIFRKASFLFSHTEMPSFVSG
jgi:hypothetical protein